MADHIFLWDNAEEITVGPILPPYTRVVLNVDEDIWYESPQQLRGGGVISVHTQLGVNEDSEKAPAEDSSGWATIVRRPMTVPYGLLDKRKCLWARTLSTLAEQPYQGDAVDVTVQYAKSGNGASAPDPESEDWTDAPPSSSGWNARTDKSYLWGRTLYKLSSGEVLLGDAWLADIACPRLPEEFFNGASGYGVALSTEYYLSTSPASLEGGFWGEVKPAFQNGRYYFVRTRIWAKWPNESYAPVYCSPVAALLMSQRTGEPFLAIDKVEPPKEGETDYSHDRAGLAEEYYLSTDRNGQKDGGWSDSYPTYERGLYFWTRLRLLWTSQKKEKDGSTTTEEEADTYTYPTAAPIPQSAMELRDSDQGTQSIEPQYNRSDSAATPPVEGDAGWGGPMSLIGRPYVWGRVVSSFAMQTPKGRTTNIEVQYAPSESKQTPPLPTSSEWRYTGVTLTQEKPYPWGRVTAILSTGERVAGTPWLADPDGRYGIACTEYHLRTYYYLSASRSELKGGSWSQTKPAYQNGRFYFVKSMIWRTQSDGVTRKTYESPVASNLILREYGEPYLIIGPDSSDCIAFDMETYLSSSGVEPRYGQWTGEGDGVPDYKTGRYYWVRHRIILNKDVDEDGEPDHIYTDPVLAPPLVSVGSVLTMDCPWATQAMADNILAQIKGYSYQPFNAGNALLDPAAELGDSITTGGVQSVIASVTISYDAILTSDVSAPSDQEIDHEYPYQQLSNRELQREISKRAWATLSVAREEIFMEVGRATRAEQTLSSRLSITAGEISLKVSRKDLISDINSEIKLTDEKISLTTSQFELTSDYLKIQDDEIQTITPSYRAVFNSGELTFYSGSTKVGSILGKNTATRYDDVQGTGYTVMDIEVSSNAMIFSIGGRYYYAFNSTLHPWDNTAKHYFSDGVYMRCGLKVGDQNNPGQIECNDLVVTGVDSVKQRVIDTSYGQVGLSAMESTYPVFSDLGSGEIGEDGAAYIFLDPDFSETVELVHSYQVHLTQTSPGRIDWTEKRDGYFIVHGETGTAFDWILYARQKGQLGSRLEQKKISVDRPNLREDMFDDMIEAYPGEREEDALYFQMESYLDEYEKEVNPEL